ncbi:TetR/AcrR family transcriptional regulator [Streptomyces paludis]|uniref:TetR/AcrR family transcriptional regulator n=1 Tax=Streptomyces paludis TaxID=2282738 RepID=UPI0013B3FF04|nr:TetR/AcrR family transcriptional regulator [Streptomyces paludis]
MNRLIEHDSAKAARILDAARELALAHDVRKVTISEIAAAAGVGKGTVYLYWETKEALFMGLLAREVLAWIDTAIDLIDQDPHHILPRRLAPLLIRTTTASPWLRRHWDSGDSTLRLLVHNAADQERFARATPDAMGKAVLPVLREHGLVRDDLSLPRQQYALHAVMVGFGTVLANPGAALALDGDESEGALADTVHLLLEPDQDPTDRAVTEAAAAVRDRFARIHTDLLELISAGAPGTR